MEWWTNPQLLEQVSKTGGLMLVLFLILVGFVAWVMKKNSDREERLIKVLDSTNIAHAAQSGEHAVHAAELRNINETVDRSLNSIEKSVGLMTQMMLRANPGHKGEGETD